MPEIETKTGIKPAFIVERLGDWNYGVFLNSQDATCIAIGRTEQDAIDTAWRRLFDALAES